MVNDGLEMSSVKIFVAKFSQVDSLYLLKRCSTLRDILINENDLRRFNLLTAFVMLLKMIREKSDSQ